MSGLVLNDFFRQIFLKKSLKNFNGLDIHILKGFNKLAMSLNRKNTIESAKTLIQKITSEPDYDVNDARKFLACYMIQKHPNVIISNETPLERRVIIKAKKLLDILNYIQDAKNTFQYNLYCKMFHKTYADYSLLFDDWKKADKMRIIDDLCSIYFQLQADKERRYQEIDAESNKHFMASIKYEQDKLVAKIRKIGGDEGVKYLDDMKKKIEDYKEQAKDMYKNIGEIVHNAFWDNVHAELSKEPPNLGVITSLLKDMRNMFCACVPNRPSIHQDIHTHMDISFINDMLKHNVVDDRYIYNMTLFIFGYLEQFQARTEDEDTKKWKAEILAELNQGAMYKDFFPKFFRGVFERLEKTMKHMEDFKNLPIYETFKDKKNNDD
jgi:hypothetical protein